MVEFSYAPMDHTQSSFEIEKIIPVYLELDIEDTNDIDLLNVNVEEIQETIEYYEPYDY